MAQRLAQLLEGDLSFQGAGRFAHPLYALHPFAARFPHGLPGYFIDALTERGDTPHIVLDPMCGSGITLLEGWSAGRSVIGVDLDPLARRQARARTIALCGAEVRLAGEATLRKTADLVAGLGAQRDPLQAVKADMDPASVEFLDYWFFRETQRELACLILAIREEPDENLRNLLEVVFSSTIVTKSGGVSRAGTWPTPARTVCPTRFPVAPFRCSPTSSSALPTLTPKSTHARWATAG